MLDRKSKKSYTSTSSSHSVVYGNGTSVDLRAFPQDSKTLGDKEATLADLQAALEKDTEAKASTTQELAATLQYIQSLHNECDWYLHSPIT